MDKYEYKIRSEEIRALIAKGEYAEAATLADTIDWRRVKSVMMLCTISDLYKINRRYEDARDMLLLAYDRHPGGRSIVYSLCELSIKMGEFVQAVEYYKEFVQVAPKDSGRYVLQYKLYEAQEVSLEERIAVLEELKSKDYTEKWAYELAYLYHRVGLGTRCVEECDELILWFGEGKYVLKALELKRLHEPLTEAQQEKYDIMKGVRRPVEEAPAEPEAVAEDLSNAPTKVIPQQDIDIQVKLMNVGQYDTINIQKELAQNMKELWEGPSADEMARAESERALAAAQAEALQEAETVVVAENSEETVADVAEQGETSEAVAEEQKVPVEEAAEETTEPQSTMDPITQAIISPLLNQETGIIDLPDPDEDEEPVEPQETKVEEIFFGETGEIDLTGTRILEQMKQEVMAPETVSKEEAAVEEQLVSTQAGDLTEWHVTQQLTKFDKILGMDYDGQISMVVPDAEQIEKQITGQIRLEDVLIEWEKMKKDSEQKRMEAVRQRVLEQTGAMFTEFEEAARDGLLEQLENGTVESIDDAMVQEALDMEETDYTDEEEPEELTGEEHALGVAGAAVVGATAVAVGSTEVSDADAEEEEYTEEVVEEEAFTGDDFEDLEEIEEVADEDTNEDSEEELVLEEEEVEYEEAETEEVEAEYEEAETDEAEAEYEEEAEMEDVESDETDGESEEESETEEVDDEAGEESETEETDDEVGEEAETEETDDEAGEESETEEIDAEIEAETEDTKEADTEDAEETTKEPAEKKETTKEHREKKKVRPMSQEEKQLFGAYIQSKPTKEQIINAIDNITMASYTGNVIITGEEGMDTLTLAKNLIKEVQQTDSNFSGKIAKISGTSLNRKDVAEIIGKLSNGALIIQKAGTLKKETADKIRNCLEQEGNGIIVVLEDTKKAMNKLLKSNEVLKECFTLRIDVEALDNDTLVTIAKEYARELEYSIDEMGVLALHTCIAERQTSDHAVTVAEVKEMVDEAIASANRKTLGHFFDVLLAKRYDDEDMIIIREKDFI
ncbi:MAG: hypothetical protein J6B90_01215 [Lachnospiraceae bacterium]|nr:hypothetical protein [Lachnospiraceae bacterium]